MELVEGYVTRMAWDTLMEWWADYRDIYAYHKQVYGSEKDVWDVLCTCIGEAGGMVLHKLWMNRLLALTEPQPSAAGGDREDSCAGWSREQSEEA